MSDDRHEPSTGDDADATRPLPGGDREAPGEPVDATRRMPRPDETAVQPGAAEGTARREPVEPTAPVPPTPPAWSGRAEVPPPRPVGYREQTTEWYTEEQAGRRWWMPILLGILALLLIALIGVGVWLALRAVDEGPEPSPSPSFRPTTAPATSAAPTSAAPTTGPPTTPPATTAAAQVPMPSLVGLPEAAARAILDQLDVDYRVETRTSDRPAGTVIETDPEAGELISEGEQVTVVVAEAPAPTTGAGTPTPSPAASGTP